MKGNKTTKEHFLIFKRECLKWIDKFGLKGWDVSFEHHNEVKDCRAFCTSHVVNRWVVLGLNTVCDWKITDRQLRQDAFHEVMELFLAQLVGLAEYRYATENEIDEQKHAIIRTLENVVFEGK